MARIGGWCHPHKIQLDTIPHISKGTRNTMESMDMYLHKCMWNCLPIYQLDNPSNTSSNRFRRKILGCTDIFKHRVLYSCQQSNRQNISKELHIFLSLVHQMCRLDICVRMFGLNCRRTMTAHLGITLHIYELMGRRITLWKLDRERHSVEWGCQRRLWQGIFWRRFWLHFRHKFCVMDRTFQRMTCFKTVQKVPDPMDRRSHSRQLMDLSTALQCKLACKLW